MRRHRGLRLNLGSTHFRGEVGELIIGITRRHASPADDSKAGSA
jgi:hypothetical protein